MGLKMGELGGDNMRSPENLGPQQMKHEGSVFSRARKALKDTLSEAKKDATKPPQGLRKLTPAFEGGVVDSSPSLFNNQPEAIPTVFKVQAPSEREAETPTTPDETTTVFNPKPSKSLEVEVSGGPNDGARIGWATRLRKRAFGTWLGRGILTGIAALGIGGILEGTGVTDVTPLRDSAPAGQNAGRTETIKGPEQFDPKALKGTIANVETITPEQYREIASTFVEKDLVKTGVFIKSEQPLDYEIYESSVKRKVTSETGTINEVSVNSSIRHKVNEGDKFISQWEGKINGEVLRGGVANFIVTASDGRGGQFRIYFSGAPINIEQEMPRIQNGPVNLSDDSLPATQIKPGDVIGTFTQGGNFGASFIKDGPVSVEIATSSSAQPVMIQ